MKRFIPDSIFARTFFVLIIGLAISHTISIALYVSDRSNTLVSIDGRHIGDRVALTERIIRLSPPPNRPGMVSRISDDIFQVTWTPTANVAADEKTSPRTLEVQKAIGEHLDPDENRMIRIRDMGMQPLVLNSADEPENIAMVMVSMTLPDQSWLNFVVPLRAPTPLWTLRYILSMAVMLIAIAGFSAIVVHQLTRPLARFASASKKLGVDMDSKDIPEKGAMEIRQASKAFNQMHRRIKRFVEDRTQMIAAISHDLGTPISRMRLRAEFVEDEEQRQKMLADLSDMEKMVSDTLSFARDEAILEPMVKVDFRALAQRVCDDIGDSGYNIEFAIGDVLIPYQCRPAAMRRALSNLIENAAKYGKIAHVNLVGDCPCIILQIDDEGPGIPQHLQEEIFEPFFRIENSRSRDTGGTGLGMTVARSIIKAHGGDISLKNRAEGGLRMEIKLPVPKV
ncbi:MAG: ATP-binding protein [Devosiaceae bacterium]|nr:ATP-binding protein [Devosiaceae bacterium]